APILASLWGSHWCAKLRTAPPAAATRHPPLSDAVDARPAPRLDDELCPTFDLDVHRLLVPEREHRVARDPAFLLAAAGQVLHAAEREHLRPVLHGRDVPHDLALRADGRALGPDVAVGVDLHLEAAITEDPFGHDAHHVDPGLPGR